MASVPLYSARLLESHSAFFVLFSQAYMGGDLLDKLLSTPGNCYDEKPTARIVKSMVNTISFLHQQGVVHRDIKLENFMFETDSPHAPVQLIDFGFAADKTFDRTLRATCGTPEYSAPEILSGQPYGKEVDCWSLGVVVFAMLFGDMPFNAISEEQMFRLIRRAEFDFPPGAARRSASRESKQFIKALLALDVDQRLTMEQAAAHPFLVEGA